MSFKLQHSLGPYSIEEIPNEGARIVSKEGATLAIIPRRFGDPYDNARADAQLFACAPELLAVLKMALVFVYDSAAYGRMSDQASDCIDVIEKIVAKVEGKS